MLTRALRSFEDEETRLARARLGQLHRDRWRLDELLGVGGTAAVYAATHRNGKRVAIKMLHASLAYSAEVKQRFLDEGYIANRVNHPGVASILDDDVAEDGSAFLVMELLEGETLDVLLDRRARLEPLELLSLMDDLLDVLAAAHAKGIVHRDIKPGNVFVTRKGTVKLLDFGVALRGDPSRRSHITPSGFTIGTPAFMAPEQARGRAEQVDARTDLWAVGATMFTALSGRHVHEAETNNEELLAAMARPAPSLAIVAQDLPQCLVDFVDRALAYERDDRWSDAAAMQAALREVHAILIEQQAQPASACDPLISLEDLTPPASSHSPVAISTTRALARTVGLDSKRSGPPLGHHAGRWLAIGGLAMLMSAVAWIGRPYQQAATRAHATQAVPSATHVPTVDVLSGAAPALDREDQVTPSADREPPNAGRTERSEATRPNPRNRVNSTHIASTAGKALSPRGAPPVHPMNSTAPKQDSPDPRDIPSEAPIDPLERRR